MTVDAERPELRVVETDLRVLPVVRRQPDHVMNVRRRSVLAAEQTVLAERMELEVRTPARLPRLAVIKRSWSRPCHWSQPPPYKASAAGQAPAASMQKARCCSGLSANPCKKPGVAPGSPQRPVFNFGGGLVQLSHSPRVHYNTDKKCVCYHLARLSRLFHQLLTPAPPRCGRVGHPLPIDFLAFGAELLVSLTASVAARLPAVALVAWRFRGGESEMVPQRKLTRHCRHLHLLVRSCLASSR